MERDENRDIHTEHCCQRHGCKYSDIHCTVTRYGGLAETGQLTGEIVYEKQQSHMCESCEFALDVEWDLILYTNEVYDLAYAAGWRRGFKSGRGVAEYMGERR